MTRAVSMLGIFPPVSVEKDLLQARLQEDLAEQCPRCKEAMLQRGAVTVLVLFLLLPNEGMIILAEDSTHDARTRSHVTTLALHRPCVMIARALDAS